MKLPTNEEIQLFKTISTDFHMYDPQSGEIHNYWSWSKTKLTQYEKLAHKMAVYLANPKPKRGRPKKEVVPYMTKNKKRKTQLAQLMENEDIRRKALRKLRKKKEENDGEDIE